jgi:TetR/AcrR family transcriptional regulator
MIGMPRSPRLPPTRRQPGRPAAEHATEVRDALLEAAGQLFAEHGASGVSLRRVAEAAGVTPAMVHYYFGGKDGLSEALLDRVLARLLERVRGVVAAGGALPDLIAVLVDSFGREPWIPVMIVREVLVEGGRYRERFISGYASKLAELLPGLLRQDIDEGLFRADLDPKLATLSLMGLTLMPFVARPVAERVFALAYDDDFLTRFAAHTHRLFIEGVQA